MWYPGFHKVCFPSGVSLCRYAAVREVDLTTGAVRRKTELDRAYFAEGLTMYKVRVGTTFPRSRYFARFKTQFD
jgi:glutamine cyclotransferase